MIYTKIYKPTRKGTVKKDGEKSFAAAFQVKPYHFLFHFACHPTYPLFLWRGTEQSATNSRKYRAVFTASGSNRNANAANYRAPQAGRTRGQMEFDLSR